MNKGTSKALMKKLNINRAFLHELQKVMFRKPGTLVSIKSCLELMIMCRGDNTTTVEAMSGGMLSIIHELSHIKQILQNDLTGVTAGIEANHALLMKSNAGGTAV